MTVANQHPSCANSWCGQRAAACAALLTVCTAIALTCCLSRRTQGRSSAPVFLNGTASVGDGDSLTVCPCLACGLLGLWSAAGPQTAPAMNHSMHAGAGQEGPPGRG